MMHFVEIGFYLAVAGWCAAHMEVLRLSRPPRRSRHQAPRPLPPGYYRPRPRFWERAYWKARK